MLIAMPILLALAAPTLDAAEPTPIAAAQESVSQRLAYGDEALQELLFWRGADANAPLVIFVHGGAWARGDMDSVIGSEKLSHWQELGYAVASVNYRLVPNASVEQQASDVAMAIAYLSSNGAQLGFDADRIALSGHSAGAHLVALVGTDPQYLRAAGLDQSALRGILAIDGAAYDVPQQFEQSGRMTRRRYEEAFGSEPARQLALSPISHTASPNAPDFLILHVNRDGARQQSRTLAAALTEAGTQAQVRGFRGRGLRGHMEINRRMGDTDYGPTRVVDRWLERVLR